MLVSETILICACYFAAAFVSLPDPSTYLFEEGNYWKIFVMAGLILLGMYFQDLYNDLKITSRILLVQQVCLAVGSALLFMAFMGYLSLELLLARWMTVVGSVGVVILVPLWRLLYWKYVVGTLRAERVLLLGNSSILGEVIAHLKVRPEVGYSIIGYLCD